jgi:hypothetical protein
MATSIAQSHREVLASINGRHALQQKGCRRLRLAAQQRWNMQSRFQIDPHTSLRSTRSGFNGKMQTDDISG